MPKYSFHFFENKCVCSIQYNGNTITKEFDNYEHTTKDIVKLFEKEEFSLYNKRTRKYTFTKFISLEEKDGLLICKNTQDNRTRYTLYDMELNQLWWTSFDTVKFINENTIKTVNKSTVQCFYKTKTEWSKEDFELKLHIPKVKESIVDFYKKETEKKSILSSVKKDEVKNSSEIFKPNESDNSCLMFVAVIVIFGIAGLLLEAVNNAVSAFFGTFNPYIIGILFIGFLVWLMNKK